MKMAKILAAAIVAGAVALSADMASAATYNLKTIDSTNKVDTGSVAYTSGEMVTFTFTVDTPYVFSFTDTGSGGTFPFPIGATATGSSGNYTETFGAYPVSGTLDYRLSAVPEPASWALLIIGVGGVGVAMRRRRGANFGGAGLTA